jgi:hypothetical protein
MMTAVHRWHGPILWILTDGWPNTALTKYGGWAGWEVGHEDVHYHRRQNRKGFCKYHFIVIMWADH